MKKIMLFSTLVLFLLGVTSCSLLQREDANPQTPKAFENEQVYNWLLENGELTDGTMISYSIKHMNGDTLAIAASQDKEVFVTFTTTMENNIVVTFSSPLLSETILSFDCEIVDQSHTGKSYECKVNKKTFTANSPEPSYIPQVIRIALT